MARIPEYPPILMGSPEQRIEMLREFLMRMVRASVDQGDFDADAESIEALKETVTALQSVLGQVQTNLGEHERNKSNPHEVTAEQLGLADVATSGSYEDLTDTPEIPEVPTALSELTDDLGSSPVHTHAQYAESGDLAEVATSGDYNDLLNRPVIPPSVGVDTQMSDTSENAVQNKVIKAYVDGHTPQITVDTVMSSTSTNAVQNKVIKAYVDGKVPDSDQFIIKTVSAVSQWSELLSGATGGAAASAFQSGYTPVGIIAIQITQNGSVMNRSPLAITSFGIRESDKWAQFSVQNISNSTLYNLGYVMIVLLKKN